ncbi:MAG: hypothetical protein Q8M40_01200 [Legionella sp.]|nr:hypothetical protein [Legionella sp.]
MFKKLYRPGISYKKVGVMLQDLIDKSSLQIDIFHQRTDEELDKKDKLMIDTSFSKRYCIVLIM